MKVSIIIVTRNRANMLNKTLLAFDDLKIPHGLIVELLIVDNGSTDNTAKVVKSHVFKLFDVKYFFEAKLGKSNGLNHGLAQCTGNIILFTDDDVRPPINWIDDMCDPIVSKNALVVAGGIKIAPNLIRPWMTAMHRCWLASTEWLTPGFPESLVGANMAISSKVLKTVSGFDPELGGGGLGFCEDVLFASQLMAAGYQFVDRLNVCIEHHFDTYRLTRCCWLKSAKRRGRSHAYLGHHWNHWRCRWGWSRQLVAQSKLIAWRLKHSHEIQIEGCHEEELNLVYQNSLIKSHFKISKTPHKYNINTTV